MEKWIIEIDRMKVRANHGVFPQERIVGNDFEVSLSVEIEPDEMDRAALEDNASLTVSYADLADIISGIMADPADLLETVALRIRNSVIGSFPQVVAGRIKVAKIPPPIPVPMARAAVELPVA
ncbi:MAG: dihydroneopterin aldolase, partial [Muribaculaceae bacterium]|nr:dihydroneopterin aldolase [Muribaculaceae bacterium]